LGLPTDFDVVQNLVGIGSVVLKMSESFVVVRFWLDDAYNSRHFSGN